MAKFIVNSIGDKAVRLSSVWAIEILPLYSGTQPEPGEIVGYQLQIRVTDPQSANIVFEYGPSIEAIQALAAPVIVALES